SHSAAEGPGAAAERFSGTLAGVRGLLGAPGTTVRLVLTPEAASVAATRRTTTALALQGCAVDGLVVNRVLPASGDPFLAGWSAAQAEQLAAVRRGAGGLPVRVQPYRPAEPLGLLALTELGELLYGDDDPAADPAADDEALRVRRDGREFVLSLALPFAGRDLSLARSGDELVVTLAGTRRLLALPSVLRRCRVVGAALADEGTPSAELHVRFVPDLDLWPDALGEQL
ncbi:MAG: ArsA family ATPase, partial [Actinomycetota bacterium]|nr:ArsA family ATPase [Actinomycetota bacterium]